MAFAFAYVAMLAFWGFSVGLVFLHASSTNRTVWFWTLVAFIPVLGPVVYFTYCYYFDTSRKAHARRQSLDRRGRLIAWPRTTEARKKHEIIAILSSFRDKEVEELILDREFNAAREMIKSRREEALSKEDSIALETYFYYSNLIDDMIHRDESPDLLLRIWGQPETAGESEPEALEPGTGPPGVPGGGDDFIDPDDEPARWYEF